MKKALLWVVVGATVLVGGLFLVVNLESPTDAYARIQKHIQKEEWGKVFINLSANTKQHLEMASLMAEQHLNALGAKSGNKKPSSKERFVRTVPKNKQLRSMLETSSYSVLSVNETGGTAILTLSVPEAAQTRTVKMLKESGSWVLDLDFSAKPN